MTFIDGARVTKRRNGVTVQTDKPSATARTCSVRDCRRARRADGTLFQTVGPWKLKLRWPVDVNTLQLSWQLHTSSRCRPTSAEPDQLGLFSVQHSALVCSYSSTYRSRRATHSATRNEAPSTTVAGTLMIIRIGMTSKAV